MITFKAGVSILGMRPELLIGLLNLQEIFNSIAAPMIVTSCTDGTHGPHSLHYQGLAADIRSQHLSSHEKELVLSRFQFSQQSQFDFILEQPGHPNEHFHLEFDPENSPSTVNPKSV